MRLFLAFLVVPLVEIALFIQVGGLIGLWPTLAVVILTAIAGAAMVKSQGRAAIAQVKRSFEELRDPTGPLAHGAMILVSGALLLTPGFFTDTVGFLLLVPAVRERVYRYIASRVVIEEVRYGHRATRDEGRPVVIDGDYEELDEPPTRGRSGWTRH